MNFIKSETCVRPDVLTNPVLTDEVRGPGWLLSVKVYPNLVKNFDINFSYLTHSRRLPHTLQQVDGKFQSDGHFVHSKAE